jgi:hypothetical protein
MVDKKVKLDKIDDLKATDPGNVEFSVKSKGSKPLADASFEMTLADGTVKKGKTDGNVKMEKMPAGQYKVSFPEDTK